MRREHLNNRWQPWRWSLGEVVPHEDVFGTTPRLLRQSEAEEHWLFPGFAVELFRDGPEDNVAGLLMTWYRAHRNGGGALDPVAEDLIAEAAAEDAAGQPYSHAPGSA